MTRPDPLQVYRQKRNFEVTPEPADNVAASAKNLIYVIQKHWASRLHYDFRLEFEGALKSWAVPKGPSLDPLVKRMAVQVEDHPLSYATFEGTIPAKQYGAGRVIIWDRGTWAPLGDAVSGLRDGKLKFEIFGQKLRGKWMLVRLKGNNEKQTPWLLVKERDSHARSGGDDDITVELPDSMGRTPSTEHTTLKNKSTDRGSDRSSLPTAAIKAALAATLAPQLATLVDTAPVGNWQYELKFDGYRLLTRIEGSSIRCYTRNGHDWTDKLPQLVQSLQTLGLASAWLDGEIVVPDGQGIPNFQLLQNAFEDKSKASANAAAAIVYYLFDMPFYAGHDLRQAPLTERRALLRSIIENNHATSIRFSETFDASSRDLVASACKLGFEGLIAKRADAPYVSGRSASWVKLKCGKRQEFVICGFTAPRGTRTGFGALVLGVHDEQGRLQYAGNVGCGFDDNTLVTLRARLDALVTHTSPFASKTAVTGKPTWVQPSLLAEVSFADWTASARLRHAVFRGLRIDKAPQAIARETALKTRALPTSLRVTHGDRVIDPHSGVTKLALVEYYAATAKLMLPHLKRRPVSLVRAPDGVGGAMFFQKHAKPGEVPGIALLDPALDPGHDPLLEIHSLQALLSSAQMNAVEFHTWNALANSLDKPDRMTFDLDPGENLPWAQMQQGALLVKTLLDELGLPAFLKTSGGKGLHVVVPLKKQHGWDTVKDFSHHIVNHLAKILPQLFVAKSGPKNRIGKIFVDYLRNGFGATTACAWTARARPGMGVSVPVHWDELSTLSSGAHWTVTNIAERREVGNTPWDNYAKSGTSLNPAMKVLDYSPRPEKK